MQSETWVVCALPHSVRRRSDVHVSLFVAPDLVPDQPGDPLSDAAVFDDWAATVVDATFELHDQAGPIECDPVLDPIEPQVWPQLFGPTTPVVGREVPDWSGRTWRSFDTANVAALGKVLHLATMYYGAVDPPAPSSHPLAKAWAAVVGDDVGTTIGGRRGFDEQGLTAQLDELLSGMSLQRWAERDRVVEPGENASVLLERMLVELHRVRRFYERPESQGAYRERPDPDAVAAPLPPHEPEFHERVTMCGDHPALLRRLGLVVDLTADVERLRESRWLTGRITPAAGPDGCRTTRVRCRTTRDGALVTVPGGTDWHDGALVLGDEDRFVVLDTDTDGTAIKAERFLWSLPRLMAVEANGDPATAATPALRASGLTVARTNQALTAQERLTRQTSLASDLATNAVPLLTTEDVVRGMRIEVWDDTTRRWRSLHRRRTDVHVTGHGLVLDDLEEEGFIQGTAAHETPDVADSPIHVHEAMFGWDGWSLAAPRPGKRIRKATPEEVAATGEDEVVEDSPTVPDTAAPHPITITNEVAPGTLPRLRFGRSYAFRAWAVDLAGNSRPHDLQPDDLSRLDDVRAVVAATGPTAVRDAGSLWAPAVRLTTHTAIAARDLELTEPVGGIEPPDDLVAALAPRLRTRRADLTGASVRGDDLAITSRLATRRSLVDEATAAAVADEAQPLVADTAVTDAAAVAALATAHLGTLHLDVTVPDLDDLVAESLGTVTKLRPFLRWEPVAPPAVVPRHPFTEGESVRVVVVRSGVTQDPDTLALTVTPPDEYAASVPPERGYGATSQRHLAPPKTTQMTAELHGRFDPGIGTTETDAARLLGWAITEDGSFLDLDRADLDSPGDRIPQPGVMLAHDAATPQAELKSLPLAPGEAPAPGQYVVHDVDDLTIPYLPDPLARGVAFVFPEAGRDRTLAFPFGGEGFTARYGGDWPGVAPYRLVLTHADELGAEVADRTVEFRLPPGDVQRARLSSSLRRRDLDLLGPWRSLAPAVRDNDDVAEAAKDGWLWGLTPFDDVLLVHAVPRPLEAPRPTILLPQRSRGQTEAVLFGGVDVHGPSTDSLVAEARWVEPDDDLLADRWQERPMSAVAFQTAVEPDEDIAVLAAQDGELLWPASPGLRAHRAIHQFGDTRHRRVTYRFRATTRFREYFHPSLLAPTHDGDDGQSVVGPEVEVDVPSTAPPAAPVVHSVIPLFRWDFGEEPEQPMGRRHVRRAGVRIYLERPWFSSGEGELLAVLLAPGASDVFGPPAADDSGYPFVSKVGQDPVWISQPVARRPLHLLALDNLLQVTGIDDRDEPGRPVAMGVHPLAGVGHDQQVRAVGYRPQYSEDRGMWYVDVAMDPGRTMWAFVRLAVARYQPSSVAGCHLSAPVRCDFVQLPPERTVSTSRTDESHVRVVVSGPIGVRDIDRPTATAATGGALGTLLAAIDRNRTVVARLQQRDPDLPTDLGWVTVDTVPLTIRGIGKNEVEAAWVGELAAGTDMALRRPNDPPAGAAVDGADDGADGTGAEWRVTVEEWERFPGDVLADREVGPLHVPVAKWEQRLVFADEVLL